MRCLSTNLLGDGAKCASANVVEAGLPQLVVRPVWGPGRTECNRLQVKAAAPILLEHSQHTQRAVMPPM